MCESLLASADQDGTIQIENKIPKTITLRESAARALLQSPVLSAFKIEKRVREARTLQLGLLPNPELEIIVEDAAGSGNFSGFDRSETTVQLGQRIELGGKREARTHAGRVSEKLADWDYEAKRLDILSDVNKSFIEVLKAQHKVALTHKLIDLGKQFLNAVAERVKSGKVAAIEKTKAEVALSTFKIELEKSKLELENSRRKLSATWGSSKPEFKSAEGDFFKISPIPLSEILLGKLSKTPYMERWKTELEQRQANVDLELSNRVPDLKLMGGVKRQEQTSDNAITFGISIPLQLFNRNQGAIARARSQLSRIQEERRAFEVEITQTFNEAYQALVFAHSQATAIKSELLPGARKAFEAVNEGYRFGKFGFLDALDSQKTLFRTRYLYLEALAAYHKAAAEVNRLTGEPVFEQNDTRENSMTEIAK